MSVQDSSIDMRNIECDSNTGRENLSTLIGKFIKDYEQDPAYQALDKRYANPTVMTDPVLSVAMECLSLVDLDVLLDNIRERQVNPSPLLLKALINDTHETTPKRNTLGKEETCQHNWGTIPKRRAEFDRWRIVWSYIKSWVVENGWKTEKVLDILKSEKRYNKYKGPLVHRDTLYKIIKAGKSGDLES